LSLQIEESIMKLQMFVVSAHGKVAAQLPADGGDGKTRLAESMKKGVENAAFAADFQRDVPRFFGKSRTDGMDGIASKSAVFKRLTPPGAGE
jgi:transaldolase